MRKAFITYIRPSLECNSNIWNPTKKYLIDKLENIQRRFTIKRVPSITLVLILLRASKAIGTWKPIFPMLGSRWEFTLGNKKGGDGK
jgi:hypothetical protein